jgi:hypothetical protein
MLEGERVEADLEGLRQQACPTPGAALHVSPVTASLLNRADHQGHDVLYCRGTARRAPTAQARKGFLHQRGSCSSPSVFFSTKQVKDVRPILDLMGTRWGLQAIGVRGDAAGRIELESPWLDGATVNL